MCKTESMSHGCWLLNIELKHGQIILGIDDQNYAANAALEIQIGSQVTSNIFDLLEYDWKIGPGLPCSTLVEDGKLTKLWIVA